MKMEWTNDLVMEFLALYEAEPAIWDPKHYSHKIRKDVQDAWKRIAFAMSSRCSIKELKRKKDSLMSIFRALCMKERKSLKFGEEGHIFKPNWFAFQTMDKFLRNVYQPKAMTKSKDSKKEWTLPKIPRDERIEHLSESPRHIKTDSSVSTSASIAKFNNRRVKTRKIAAKRRMGSAIDILKSVCDKDEKDDCALFGELLAIKLRGFDENTREVVMNEIDNLVFRTKMNSKKGPNLLQPNYSIETEYSDQSSVQDISGNADANSAKG